ncbi:MAG: hypothetical protein AAF360_03935 [Pseudomonadota bacterium]
MRGFETLAEDDPLQPGKAALSRRLTKKASEVVDYAASWRWRR